MTNEEFMKKLNYLDSIVYTECNDIVNHAKKLVAVVEAIKNAKHDLEPMFVSTQKVVEALEDLERE